MPATTPAQMEAGRDVLRQGDDKIIVIIAGVDSYKIRDLRPSSDMGREGSGSSGAYETLDYDTTRTTFNTSMVDLS